MKKNLHILELINKRFNVGRISIRSDVKDMFRYKVNNLNEIVDVIVPFFKNHLYNYGKGLDFILWSNILDMIKKNIIYLMIV